LFLIVMSAMLQPRLDHVNCPHPEGQHRMAYWSWGDASAPQLLVCAHGLTRQGRDFDRLASALVARSATPLRVVCPDVAGRGQSEWLPAGALYQIQQYASDMLALLAQLHSQTPIAQLDWMGTSMGGLIGLVLAGQPGLPMPASVRRLVLNDVGPSISWASVQRMQQYAGRYGRYADLAEAAAALRALSLGFGPVPDDVWLDMSSHMVRDLPEGGVTLHYDPAIGEPVRALTQEAAQAGEAVMWSLYDQIQADVLVIRGQDSDLLLPQTAQAMTERGPKARLLEWPGIGHAPTLTAPEQIDALADFLLK
jgi:pimeloyl-ACP methyl ester carboxylesterase